MTDDDPDDDLGDLLGDLLGTPGLALEDEPLDPETTAHDLGLGDDPDLPPNRAHFAALIARGCTVTAAAERVGVTRQTGSEWLNHDPAVQAAVNRARRAVAVDLLDQANALSADALAVVRSAVRAGNLDASLTVLRILGVPDTIDAERRAQRRAPTTTAAVEAEARAVAIAQARDAETQRFDAALHGIGSA